MLRFVAPFVFLAACASGGVGSPTAPAVNEEFTLAPGQTAVVTGTSLRRHLRDRARRLALPDRRHLRLGRRRHRRAAR